MGAQKSYTIQIIRLQKIYNLCDLFICIQEIAETHEQMWYLRNFWNNAKIIAVDKLMQISHSIE